MAGSTQAVPSNPGRSVETMSVSECAAVKAVTIERASRSAGRVSLATAQDALALFEVDELGLDKVDRAILSALCRTFVGRAVGLGTLAVAVGEAPETVEDVYEPFLLQCGLLERTPRGRMATPSARSA